MRELERLPSLLPLRKLYLSFRLVAWMRQMQMETISKTTQMFFMLKNRNIHLTESSQGTNQAIAVCNVRSEKAMMQTAVPPVFSLLIKV